MNGGRAGLPGAQVQSRLRRLVERGPPTAYLGPISAHLALRPLRRPVFRTYGAAAAAEVADMVDVRIRVEGACAEHLPLVKQLLSRDVTAGGTVVSQHHPESVRPQDLIGWAATVRAALAQHSGPRGGAHRTSAAS